MSLLSLLSKQSTDAEGLLQELDLFVAVGAISFSRYAATAVANGDDPTEAKFLVVVVILMGAVIIVSGLNLVGLAELIKEEYGEAMDSLFRQLRRRLGLRAAEGEPPEQEQDKPHLSSPHTIATDWTVLIVPDR